MFKWLFRSPAPEGKPSGNGRFCCIRSFMNLFVYADESGVLDPKHNDFFVFGGIIFLGKEARDDAARKYLHAERALRESNASLDSIPEIKASVISNKQKGKLFRSLNNEHSFGVVVEQKRLKEYIYSHKKKKQRYLDYVFKIALKRALQGMMRDGVFSASEIENIYVRMDEHSTATDGRYELQEGLEEEFKHGTTNYDWDRYFPPIFPDMQEVRLEMRDSAQDPLIRASDIVANRLFFCARTRDYSLVRNKIRFIIQP